DNLLVRHGRAHATAVLEYMAQAIAALAGLRARDRGQSPTLGMIAACRGLELFAEHLLVGDRLRIDADRTWPPPDDGDEFADYRARVTRDGALVASADIHVVRRSP